MRYDFRVMNWKLFFKHRKNKILATSLSGIALAILLSYHILGVILYGSSYFDFRTLWNAALTLVVYTIIFVCNIRNDNFAYTGILGFVFFITFDNIYSLFVSGIFDAPALFSGQAEPGVVAIFALTLLGNAAMAVSGIVLYIWIRRYMFGVLSDFNKIRVMGIVFAGLLLVAAGFGIGLFMLLGLYDPTFLWLLYAQPVSEVVMAIAICFTLERLRRI